MKYKSKKGFTLAELLIVVAVIAVLVAIGIAVFSGHLEKARRAVDMQTARNIKSVLTNAYNDGTLQVPDNKKNDKWGYGAWVLICKDSSSLPEAYKTSMMRGGGTVFCGADPGVIVKGTASAEWNSFNDNIAEILEESGININSLKTTADKSDTKNGWAWIVIEVGYANYELYSRIYSGFSGKPSGLAVNGYGKTNIERQTTHTN